MTPVTFFFAGSPDITIQFPTQWNELTYKDLLCTADFINDKIDQYELLISLLKNRTPKSLSISLIDPEQLAIEALPLIDFIKKSIELTVFPFKGDKKIKNYADNFLDMTVGVFENCDTEYTLFIKKDRDKYHFNEFLQHLLGDYSHKLSIRKKTIALLWYIGCRNQLPKKFENLYKGASYSSTEATGLEFTNIIHMGAGPRNGLREEIRELLLNEFMYDMDLEAKRNADIQAEIENMNS